MRIYGVDTHDGRTGLWMELVGSLQRNPELVEILADMAHSNHEGLRREAGVMIQRFHLSERTARDDSILADERAPPDLVGMVLDYRRVASDLKWAETEERAEQAVSKSFQREWERQAGTTAAIGTSFADWMFMEPHRDLTRGLQIMRLRENLRDLDTRIDKAIERSRAENMSE